MKQQLDQNQDYGKLISDNHHPRVRGLMPGLNNRLLNTAPAVSHVEYLQTPKSEAVSAKSSHKLAKFFRRLIDFILAYRLHYYAAIGVTVLLVLQVALFYANFIRGSQPILGLHFGGQDITNYDRGRLAQALNLAIAKVEKDPLIVHAGSATTRLTARQLGARYNTNSLISAVYGKGKSGSIWSQIAVQDAALFGQYSFRLGFPDINAELTQNYLNMVNNSVKTEPTNANFAFNNNKVTITPGIPGYTLDMAGSLKVLRNYDPTVDNQSIKLPLKPIQPVIGDYELRKLMPDVNRVTNKPLKVNVGDASATISRSALTNMLAVESIADPRRPTKSKANIVINQLAADKVATQLLLNFDQTAHTKITNGNGSKAYVGRDGKVLDGIETKVALITQILLRKQQIIDQNKPLALYSHQIPAPTIPKQLDNSKFDGKISAYVGDKQRVILSFDGMPNATYGPQILDILKRYGAHSIFFVVGRNAISYPDVVKRISDEGNILGISTYSYKDVAKLSGNDLKDEILKSKDIVGKITGIQPKLFRSPLSTTTNETNDVLAKNNLMNLSWTVDSLDWGQLSDNIIANHVVNNAHAGDIVLLHALNDKTVQALPKIINGLRNKGFVVN